MNDQITNYARHKFESGIVQISAEIKNGEPCIRLAIKRVNTAQDALIDIVSLIYPKKYIEAANAVIDNLVEADFIRANTLLTKELKKLEI